MAQQRYEYEVEIVDIIPTAANAKVYVFDLADRPFDYRTGQFLQIYFDPKAVLEYAEKRLAKGELKPEDMERIKVRAKKNSREYSICNPPSRQGYLEVIVESVEGGSFSPWFVDNAKVGDRVKIAGPLGRFFFDDNNKKVCLMAAGSGIAAITCMIRNVVDKDLNGEFVLIYSSRSRQHISYRQELEEIVRARKNIHVFHTLTRLNEHEKQVWKGYTRRIDADMVKECLDKVGLNPRECHYYLCGSPAFLKAACNPVSMTNPGEQKGCLDMLGVAKESISTEIF